MENSQVGKTKHQGWEFGVRRTFPVSSERAWELLMTQPGMDAWFGQDPDFIPQKDVSFETTNGTIGRVVGFKEGSLLRLRWQPRGWDTPSTLQIRVISSGDKATISIHHEQLADATQRQAMKHHWNAVLDQLQKYIKEL